MELLFNNSTRIQEVMSWICQYCNKDTKYIDMEYLVGYDHLQCVLENMNDKKQFMKIKGWEKISGYTYKGYTIVNPIHNAEETKYEATILNLNLPQKPKWELNVLTPAHKFKQDNHFSITMWDDQDYLTRRQLTIQRMRSISIFRNTFEEMIDELLKIQLTSAPISHSIVNNSSYGAPINPNNYGKLTVAGTGGGILTTINSNANNVVWDPNTNLPSSMLMAIKDLQKQIDDLKK